MKRCDKCGTTYEPVAWDVARGEQTAHRKDDCIEALASHLAASRRRVLVGVALVLRRGPSVLMGLRKGSHGAGTWSLPGGHLEPGESVAACAARELLEESGIAADPQTFHKLTFTNDVMRAEGKHYVTLYMEADAWSSMPAPEVREPDKCGAWSWFDAPPEPLFLPIQNLLRDGPWIWKNASYGPWIGKGSAP